MAQPIPFASVKGHTFLMDLSPTCHLSNISYPTGLWKIYNPFNPYQDAGWETWLLSFFKWENKNPPDLARVKILKSVLASGLRWSVEFLSLSFFEKLEVLSQLQFEALLASVSQFFNFQSFQGYVIMSQPVPRVSPSWYLQVIRFVWIIH